MHDGCVVGRTVRDTKPDSPRSCWGVRCTSRLHLPCAKLISLRSHPHRGSCRSTYSRRPHYPCRLVAHEYQSPRDEGTPTEVGKLSAHVKPKVFFEHHSASKNYLPGSSQIHVLRTKSIERETAIEKQEPFGKCQHRWPRVGFRGSRGRRKTSTRRGEGVSGFSRPQDAFVETRAVEQKRTGARARWFGSFRRWGISTYLCAHHR